MEPGQILQSLVDLNRRVLAPYRSSHIRLFSRRQRHPLVFSFRSTAHDPGVAGVSLSHHVSGNSGTPARLFAFWAGLCDSQPERAGNGKESPTVSVVLYFARDLHRNIYAPGSGLESHLAVSEQSLLF